MVFLKPIVTCMFAMVVIIQPFLKHLFDYADKARVIPKLLLGSYNSKN